MERSAVTAIVPFVAFAVEFADQDRAAYITGNGPERLGSFADPRERSPDKIAHGLHSSDVATISKRIPPMIAHVGIFFERSRSTTTAGSSVVTLSS